MKRVSIMLCAVAACAFISCENDDAAIYSEKEILEGNKALATIVEVAFADNDKSKVETPEKNTFYYSVDDVDDAHAFVNAVTRGNYSDESPTYVLPAGFGKVDIKSLEKESDKYYYLMDFDVVGYSGIRYIVASNEHVSNIQEFKVE